jgi:hypothetical protein
LKLGGFHEERRVGHEDWKLLGQAVLKGYHLEVVPDALVWYRRTDAEENATARNSLHAGYMQNIQPYLDAVPPALRNLILYAQGISFRPPANDTVIMQYAQLTIVWKAKLEAALALAKLKLNQEAVKLMLEGIKSVEKCTDPRVTLEALVEISAQLGKLDPGRARYLLEIAVKLADQMGRKQDSNRAKQLLVDFAVKPAMRPPARAHLAAAGV